MLQPPPSQIHTRSNQEPGHIPTYEELLKRTRVNQDGNSSARVPRKTGLHAAGRARGRTLLSYTLLLLLHAVTLSILPKGIRAVAMLLEHKEAS